MEKKVLIGIISISLLFLFLLNFSSATIATISPINGTNHSSAVLVLFNVTFVNNTDMLIFGTSQTNVNATFFRVNGTQRTLITNSSQCAIAGTAVTCWTSFNVSGIDGFYNITSTIYNATAQLNSSINSTSVYFDSTRPSVTSANFSGPAIGGNYSGILILNVSAIDIGTGIRTLYFNITNSSGAHNATIFATNSAGNVWNATIDTSTFIDGVYNITVFTNDTLGNLNNSARIQSVVFDNTDPTGSVSCDPDPVEKDEEMTCTCSPTDALSGIASTTFNSNPSTASTGTYSSTCDFTDYAGNQGTASEEYLVYEEGGSSGGSSSGSSGGTTGLSPPTSGTSSGSGSSGGSSSGEEPESSVTVTDGEGSESGASRAGRFTGETITWLIIFAAIGITIALVIMELVKRRR